jgi:hypothetical protein
MLVYTILGKGTDKILFMDKIVCRFFEFEYNMLYICNALMNQIVKKWTFMLLLLVANTLLLAHNIVPHHHHNGLPHFCWPMSHHSEEDGECHDCCCHHENGETCLFDQIIDVISETKDDCSSVLCASSHHHHHPEMLLQAVLLTFTYDLSPVPEELSGGVPPYLINYYSHLANTALGLRAPPVERG